jgi:hypothetical protein
MAVPDKRTADMGAALALRTMLSGGDRRSIGRADEVAALLRDCPERVGELVELLWDLDEVIKMRTADALEKLSREGAEWLEPFKAELLGLMAETRQQEVRWHLAEILPRLRLTDAECGRAAAILEGYLEDRSSIVKTFAMQGLWELSRRDSKLRARTIELIQELTRMGTAAMRARGRKLLKELES